MCATQRATSVPEDFMLGACFQRENVTHDSTVVGPAGGTLLFLITPTPSYRIRYVQQLSSVRGNVGHIQYTLDSEMLSE